MKVLVVDDEPVSRQVAATIVRRLGQEVTTASDGDDVSRANTPGVATPFA
ncbi:MAG: hypothetical protein H0V42_04630 [Nocardioidaceae bacterium]|nr:hypothetical protein [Nocardioidaceae bacterium]